MPVRPAVAVAVVTALGLSSVGLAVAPGLALPASASLAQSAVVSATPSARTPQVLDGVVRSITKVGGTVVTGGAFARVGAATGTATYARSNLVAFNAATGAVSQTFAPVFDGPVAALLPGPVAGTVFVGGGFTRVNGQPVKSLVLLRLSDGSIDPTFRTPVMTGKVQALRSVASTGRLYVGGTFARVGGQLHGGIVALDRRTGAVDPSVTSTVAEHHNWTPDSPPQWPKGAIGIDAMDITPDGRRLVAVGNFKTVDGQPRDQVVMFDLTGPRAVLADWRTTGYEATCLEGNYDSYVRDIDFAPDGSYFAVVSTGSQFAGTLCDTVARWETGATGQDVRPTWTDGSGGDSLLSVAVTGQAVYVGGHQRWLNNPRGKDSPGPGAVPRPGLAALDPATGLPLAWNPGRNPRGAGAYELFATADGLYVGSDTDYIGNRQYLRRKLAFFPLAGGRPAASKAVAGLPGTVYLGGPAATPATVTARSFDGARAGAPTVPAAQFDPRTARGATLIGGVLWYGAADGSLHTRTFDGASYGPDVRVDPYGDPAWAGVQTGSGGTYLGRATSFSADIPKLTSLAYDPRSSRLYYTVAGLSGLYYRTFSPDSGIVTQDRMQVRGALPQVSGMFLVGGQLYYVDRADGALRRAAFNGTALGAARTVVSGPAKDGVDWRSQVLFLGPRTG